MAMKEFAEIGIDIDFQSGEDRAILDLRTGQLDLIRLQGYYFVSFTVPCTEWHWVN
jgi:hypothetical protein